MNDPIVPFDIGRMLLGEEPPLFLFEIVIRTIIIYAYTLFLIRWIGSRSIAQLSLVEFLLVIALGSAVGDAMFYPDVPLIHCMVVITVVVLLDKTLGYIVVRYPRLEDAIEGKSVQVVRDGIISCKALRQLDVGHDEMFEQLRLNGVTQLGQVRAAYLETNGMLSVFKKEDDPAPRGLSIEPPWDVSRPKEYKAFNRAPGGSAVVCAQCGEVRDVAAEDVLPACPHCGGTIWHRLEREVDIPSEDIRG